MFSASRTVAVAIVVILFAGSEVPASVNPIRVCADPNNLPFSNQRQQGFENRIAALVASDLGRPLAYFWLPQRRGFVRNSIAAGRCDLVVGVPAHYALLQTTRSYYRSSYVFVSRRDRGLRVDSFDAPALETLRIGIQVSGDDYNNPPAAQALAVRHLVQNVRGFPVYGDYSQSDPQRDIVDAVADKRVDIAVVWGPLAGYYAGRVSTPLALTPVAESQSHGSLGSTFSFEIAMGVKRGDDALRIALDRVIARRGGEIRRILRAYGVPLS